MNSEEKMMIKQALEKRNDKDNYKEMVIWCEENLVYRLPASGWVIGKNPNCISLNFTELYTKFINR